MSPSTRIGLIGYGYIGRSLCERIRAMPAAGLEVAFVHNRSPGRLADVPPGVVLGDLAAMAARGAGLVIETAHPRYTREFGEAILAHADYMPLSVTALADDALRERLLAAAARSGRRLLVPHGALMGTDNLVERRDTWAEVEITFIKNPANIDFAASDFDPGRIAGETVVYDGPVRGIAARYPRNVNTMVTCALATVGLDRCRARLIARPGMDHAVAEVRARGRDGSTLVMRKEQPMAGVSGTEMIDALFASILRASGVRETLAFV